MVILFTGKPASVHLTCSLYSVYTIQCNWSIPYTIMGISITGYNINITSNSILVHQSLVTSTEYYFNVSQFGVHNISVVAVINDLEGVIDSMMIEVPEGIPTVIIIIIHVSFIIEFLYFIVAIENWSLGVNYIDGIQTVNCSILVCTLY